MLNFDSGTVPDLNKICVNRILIDYRFVPINKARLNRNFSSACVNGLPFTSNHIHWLVLHLVMLCEGNSIVHAHAFIFIQSRVEPSRSSPPSRRRKKQALMRQIHVMQP